MINGTCQICGIEGYVELHHIVFRKQASYMKNIQMNLIEACPHCHRSSPYGIHNNKKLDSRLKFELQTKYNGLFSDKKFFSREEIQEKLQCTDFDITLICKKLCLYRFGYEKEQIVRRLMGGALCK